MSLIQCPECGTKISNKATTCPYCGYMSTDCSRPICEQDNYEVVPVFRYDLDEWDPNKSQLHILTIEDNKTLVQYLGNWQNIQLRIPAIAKVIKAMAKEDKILVANMDRYIMKMIDEGIYRFTVDKKGNILPTIRNSNGIVKQVRLKEMILTPELSASLSNLTTHAAMAQILNEIEYVGDSIRGIHIELQNDRIAFAESIKDRLLLATKIQDTKLREIAILTAVSSATEAKRILMKNFSENLKFVSEYTGKTDVQLMFEGKKGKDIPEKVSDAFQALILITNTVQMECEGYALLGEYGSSKESLLQFKEFIIENKLDDRDTLLLLNENTPMKKIKIVDEFMHISKNITNFDVGKQLNENEGVKIMEVNRNENKKR